MSREQRHQRRDRARVEQLARARYEVRPEDVRRCRDCGFGPLAWVENPGGKPCLCNVYEQPDGRLLVNTKHGHTYRACKSGSSRSSAQLT